MTERKRIPIDLPDDFGTDDAKRGDLLVIGITSAVLLAVLVAAAILIGAFQ